MVSPQQGVVTRNRGGTGRWSVRAGPRGTELVWRAAHRLPTTDARPVFRGDGALLGYPRLGPDGRTLRLPLAEGSTTSVRDVEVWLGSRRLDGPQPSVSHAQLPTRPPPQATTPSHDPGEPGPYRVASFDYTSADLPWPDFDAPMEVLGHAQLPVGVDDAPLVLFLHGRHTSCYGPDDPGLWPCAPTAQPVPSYLGYRYLQRVLASQGYATVSISANAVNAQDWVSLDGGAAARATLVRHHLDVLAGWSRDPANVQWGGRLRMDRIVLVGHSRGGEGVNQAAIDSEDFGPYDLAGQVLLAPTDFGYQTAPYHPTAVVLPYCDGDVSDLQGQRYVDAARELDPADSSLRSSVVLRGANHNFFNTEWTPGISAAPSYDDWWDDEDPVCSPSRSSTRLTAAQQRRAAETFVAAAVHAFVGDDVAAALRYLDADTAVAVPAAGPAVAWTHALGGRRVTHSIDDGASVTGAAEPCDAGQPLGESAPPLCGIADYFFRQVHWTPTYRWPASVHAAYTGAGLPRHASVSWAAPGEEGGLALTEPMNLAAADSTLDLRVVVDPRSDAAAVQVVLGSGAQRWAGPEQALAPMPGSPLLTPVWAQTLRVDPRDYQGHVDLAHVDAVLLRGVSPTGRLWLLDVSRRRPGLARVPDRSLPHVRLGSAIQREHAAGVVRVPFEVLGEVRTPATLAVAAEQSTWGFFAPPSVATVTIEPGQTDGHVAVPYESDDLDDPTRQTQLLYAVGRRGVVTSGYVGTAVILDDDPKPALRFAVGRKRIHYGETIRFDVTLSAPVDYDVVNRLRAVHPAGTRPLRTSDVRRRWLLREVGEVPHDVPLSRVWRYGFVDLPAGSTHAATTVPTRRHPLHNRAKTLTVRLTTDFAPGRSYATVSVSQR